MTPMQSLSASVSLSSVDKEANLPYPNIYWVTVNHSDLGTFNTYIAGEFTASALKKTESWCRETHGFVPHRSNSVIKMRRMLMVDVLSRPDVFDTALANAQKRGESDIVSALQKFPAYIRSQLGMEQVDVAKADSLWNRLVSEVERYSGQSRSKGC